MGAFLHGDELDAGSDPADAQRAPATVSCPGDANRDRAVDLPDLGVLLKHFGAIVGSGTAGDLDGSGLLDLGDLNVLLFPFGRSCP